MRNPLPACGGTDPEPVGRGASCSRRSRSSRGCERAVTADDYAALAGQRARRAARRGAACAGPAAGTRRRSRSTRSATDDLPPELAPPGARAPRPLPPDRPRPARRARRTTCRSTSALRVCVLPHHLRGEVGQRCSTRSATGRCRRRRGFFHPDSLTFGDDVALSRWSPPPRPDRRRERRGPALRAPRRGRPRASWRRGVLRLGPLEIARLDNDPVQPENGRLDARAARRTMSAAAAAAAARAAAPPGRCGCCEGIEPATPRSIANPPGRTRSSYRVGTHGTFLATMLARLSGSDYPELHALTARGRRRPGDRAARRLGDGRRRADLLPGADRQRGLPADGDRAPLGARAGPAGRLRAAPGRRRQRPPRLHARQDLAGKDTVVTIPRAAGPRACPGPGELPQTFETAEDLIAGSAWNDLRAAALAPGRAWSPARAADAAPRSTSTASRRAEAGRPGAARVRPRGDERVP